MPVLAWEVSSQLSGISSIRTPGDYPFHLRLRCGNCGELSPKPVVVSESDSVEGIRGAAVGLKIGCKLCERVADVTVLPGDNVYTADDAPQWKRFARFECRGTEIQEIVLADDVPLVIKGDNGFEFEDAYIEDGEFYDYDEKDKKEVSITEWQTRVVKA